MDTVRQAGEPMISGFDPRRLAVNLAQLGFRVVENIDPVQQQQQYFSGRTDGLHATEHFHFVLAEVIESIADN
jgi:O-methyltransferase involved in polyketide biosynthesis